MSGPVRYHLGDFPPERLDWERLVTLVGQANAALARYDGLLAAIPNASVLLAPLTVQEAVLSSKIEGTNVTMSEVLEIEAGAGEGVSAPKRSDAEEVLNYRTALRFAASAVRERPLSPQHRRGTHRILSLVHSQLRPLCLTRGHFVRQKRRCVECMRHKLDAGGES